MEINEDHAWLEISLTIGNSRLPAQISVRLDGIVALSIGTDEVHGEYSTLLSPDEVADLIQMLQIAHDAAVAPQEMNADGN